MSDDLIVKPIDPAAGIPVGRRGRPRLPEPGVRLSTWLPASEYDQLCRLAAEREMHLSSLVRWLLWLEVGPKP